MLTLGWHGNVRYDETVDNPTFALHDAAAVLLRDNQIVAAIEEERLNRIKHSSAFPARAIRFCLQQAGVQLQDVDAIVTDMGEDYGDFISAQAAMADAREPFQSARNIVATVFEREFGIDVSERLQFCKHHVAHLHSAWYPSGFGEALVLCIDGDGDGSAGLIAHCGPQGTRVLRMLPLELSLGHLYLEQLFFLGYDRFDEYKAMGLAPYGDPARFEPLFARMYELKPDGRYNLGTRLQRREIAREAGIIPRARRKGGPFTQEHKDYAAALQATLEKIVDHIVAHFARTTGAQDLCLSGGVAHNCTLNGRLARSGRWRRIYVQPAAHDAGNALGAAVWSARNSGISFPGTPLLSHLFHGTDIGDAKEIEGRLQGWAPLVEFRRVDEPAVVAAQLMAEGKVIGWVQGRSEFGPRALGNRSILADARPAQNKDIINAMIKKREAYRPFAPAVLAERLHDYFEVPKSVASVPFMIVVLPVRESARAVLGAVTHVDGSARVQSVSREDNPRFHRLIEAFGELTGVPVVLNTSFNNHAEPIVDSVDDAVTTFLTTGIHATIVGDWLITRSSGAQTENRLLDFSVSLGSSHKLVRQVSREGVAAFSVECTAGRHSAARSTPVSKTLYRLIQEDSGTAADVCDRLHVDELARSELAREIRDLWTNRVVQLVPVRR